MAPPIALPLDWLRSISDAFLPDLADVSRYTETSTADGVTQDWVVFSTAVPCRVSRPSRAANERAAVGTAILQSISDWTVWLPFATDITERDRITVHGADRTDERTFEVESVSQKTNETARACGCVLLR